MEKVLTFFTETLSGTTYIIVVIIAVILFFACIGFLAERSIIRKKKMEQYAKANTNMETSPVKEPVTPQVQAQVQPSVAQPQNVTASPSSAPQMRVGVSSPNVSATVMQPSTVAPPPVSQVRPVVNQAPPVQNTPVTPTTSSPVIPEITPASPSVDQSDVL